MRRRMCRGCKKGMGRSVMQSKGTEAAKVRYSSQVSSVLSVLTLGRYVGCPGLGTCAGGWCRMERCEDEY